jgi:hemolysin-activating ACP:hemolysin acyltransferase
MTKCAGMTERVRPARLDRGAKILAPGDWKCGDSPFIVYLIAPFGGEERATASAARNNAAYSAAWDIRCAWAAV